MSETGAGAVSVWESARVPVMQVAAATTLVVLSFSMLNPVLAVRLQAAGASASSIGVFAMLPFLSIAAMVPWLPRVFERLGVARAYRLGLCLQALATLGYAATESYSLWCVLAVMGGLGAAAAWNGTEAIIAHNAPPERRGRMTGLYQTVLGAALALGPFMPALLPIGPFGLTVLAAVLLVMGVAVTVGPRVGALRASHAGAAGLGLWSAIRRVPGLVGIAFVGGVFEAGLGFITTAHGSQAGLSLAAAATIAGALGLGSFALQYPSGWLADHVSPRRVFSSAALLLLAASAVFAMADHWPAVLWVSAFSWGAVGGALYTLTMIRVAHEFATSSAIAGTAAMITGYTLGGAFGPLWSGVMLDTSGVTGQALWLSLLCLGVLAVSRRMGDRIGAGR